MPELPEIENLRRGLIRAIVGQKILSVKINKPKLVSDKGTLRKASQKKVNEFIYGVKGERFLGVKRRAKNLIFNLSHGKILLGHLKMSGQFVYKSKRKMITGGHPIELSEKELPNKHTHIIFKLQNGTLYYNDIRMFGYLLYYSNKKAFENDKHFDSYGVEPLSKQFTPKYFYDTLKNKRGKIKMLLMNQKIVTGIGNIYADESLFEAKIRPDRKASSVSNVEIKKLHKTIIRILNRATRMGGSSVATYRLVDETRGNYAREHRVYGKNGKECPNCHKALSKTIIGGRTTIFCSYCQK